MMLLVSVIPLWGQQWQLDHESSPEITISGTSTLTDWTVTCANVQDTPDQLNLDLQNPGQIAEFGFKVPVANMDGGRGSSMNDKILNAFQSSQHPFVEYQQTSPARVSVPDQSGAVTITSSGNLSMAGATKAVEIKSTAVIKDGKLLISGSKDIKMSDFGITPPSAMFGQIKTNDDVVVSYQFQYIKL